MAARGTHSVVSSEFSDDQIERERDLVLRAKRGDLACIDEIYSLYCKRVYNCCIRITGNESDAQELTQTVFCKFISHLDKIDIDRLVTGSYLLTMARHASFNLIKRRARSLPVDDLSGPAGVKQEHKVELEVDPERRLLQLSQNSALLDAITQLSANQRYALVMRELEGLDYASIGAELGLKPNAVAQLLSRARLKLRRVMVASAQSDHARGTCSTASLLISQKLDGEIDDIGLLRLDAHLARCRYCRDSLAAAQEAGTTYRSTLPLPTALAAFVLSEARAAGAAVARTYAPVTKRLGHKTSTTFVMTIAAVLTVAAVTGSSRFVGKDYGGTSGDRPDHAKPAVGMPVGPLAGAGNRQEGSTGRNTNLRRDRRPPSLVQQAGTGRSGMWVDGRRTGRQRTTSGASPKAGSIGGHNAGGRKITPKYRARTGGKSDTGQSTAAYGVDQQDDSGKESGQDYKQPVGVLQMSLAPESGSQQNESGAGNSSECGVDGCHPPPNCGVDGC